MEFNNPSEIVKTLTFGQEAKEQIMQGVEKLSNAVKSTKVKARICTEN